MSNCYDRFVMIEGEEDSFETWQGLRGPYYTPSVSEDGTLSWTNNGGLPNPANVNIKGPPGPGGVPGGTTGQLLAKASNEDYDTEWIDQPEMDAGHVSYDSTEAYDDGTVGKELGTINSALSSLSSVTEIIDTASGAIASFPDGSGLPMRSLLAQIEPQQDLHGQTSPYPAGGGKNLLPMMLANMKTINTAGTWNGNAYTLYGVTYTVNVDDGGNVVSISATGTATQYGLFRLVNEWTNTSATTISGTASGSSGSGYRLQVESNGTVITQDTGTQGSIPANTSVTRVIIVVPNGVNPSGAVFKPMVRLSSVSDATFAPYSNECPISGWTGLSGKRDGKNLLDRSSPDRPNSLVATDGTISGNNNFDTWYFKHVGDFAISITVTEANNNGRVVIMNADGTKDTTVTLPTTVGRGSATFSLADGQIAYISIRKSATDCQIETGSTPTDYEAYTSLPITCTWQSEAGTVYGGTVDVVSGVLTVDRAKLVLDENIPSGANGFRNISVLTNGVRAEYYPYRAVGRANSVVLSDKFRYGSVSDGTPFYVGTSETNPRMYITLPLEYDTEEEVRAWFASNPSEFVYYLATPQTYQLTPQQIETLLGNNTVFVDCGSVSVTYQASIKGYIDKVLGA